MRHESDYCQDITRPFPRLSGSSSPHLDLSFTHRVSEGGNRKEKEVRQKKREEESRGEF
jgi:hypothetical protein